MNPLKNIIEKENKKIIIGNKIFKTQIKCEKYTRTILQLISHKVYKCQKN